MTLKPTVVKKLHLYTTLGCHLCELAEDLLRPIILNSHYELSLVEISERDELMEKYALRIPVIALAATDEELAWPFDQYQLRTLLGL